MMLLFGTVLCALSTYLDWIKEKVYCSCDYYTVNPFTVCNFCLKKFETMDRLCLMPVHAFCTENVCKKSEPVCDPTKMCLNKNNERHGMCESCAHLRHKCFRVNNVCSANIIVKKTQYRVCAQPAIGSDEDNLSLCLDCTKTKNIVRNGGYKFFNSHQELFSSRHMAISEELSRRYVFGQRFVQSLDNGHRYWEDGLNRELLKPEVPEKETVPKYDIVRAFLSRVPPFYAEMNKYELSERPSIKALDLFVDKIKNPNDNAFLENNQCDECTFKSIKQNMSFLGLNKISGVDDYSRVKWTTSDNGGDPYFIKNKYVRAAFSMPKNFATNMSLHTYYARIFPGEYFYSPNNPYTENHPLSHFESLSVRQSEYSILDTYRLSDYLGCDGGKEPIRIKNRWELFFIFYFLCVNHTLLFLTVLVQCVHCVQNPHVYWYLKKRRLFLLLSMEGITTKRICRYVVLLLIENGDLSSSFLVP